MHALRALATLHAPSVILVTESWCCDSTNDSSINISGYTLFRKDRSNKRGGGCLIYASTHLNAQQFSHPTLECHLESLWISTTICVPSVIIGCVYVPPNPNRMDLLSLINTFNLLVEAPFKAKVIAGDFDMPGLGRGPRHSSAARDLMATTQTLGWSQLVNSPTRKLSILDLIFTLNIPSNSVCVLDNFPGSDHRMVACSFKVAFNRGLISSTPPLNANANLGHSGLLTVLAPRPRLRTADWSTFASLLRYANWDEFFSPLTILWLLVCLQTQR